MDSSCGIGCFRPKWLNRFASVKSFMAVYGLLGMTQAMAFVYLVVTLTTMERRFKIPSKTTGIMLTGNEISQILLSLILSYHGAHRNRPRWIAWGVAFSAISCFVVALPHFVYGPGVDALELTKDYAEFAKNLTTQSTTEQLCIETTRNEQCDSQELTGDFSVIPLVLVFLSQFILGIGNTLYFALGQTYLDDNTKKSQTPVLLGWTLALRTLGPAIGFVLAHVCLKMYIDPSKTPLIDEKDPRWLGAWWLGWILLGTVMILFAILMAMFPQHLPPPKSKPTPEEEALRPLEEAAGNGLHNSIMLVKTPEIPKFRDFSKALKRLLRNKLLMYNNLSGIFYILGASGYITYISKYLEVQFQESATYTVITGPTMLVGMVAGFLISGYFITQYKPKPKYLLGWNVVIGIIFIIGQYVFMELDCPIKDVHSLTNDPQSFQLQETCNTNCSCELVKYAPVCEIETQTTYFSPCHAGCKNMVTKTKPLFTECSCTNPEFYLQDGPCLTDCINTFIMYVIISFVINFMGSSGRIGNLLVNYRSVDIKDKSFAQGLTLWMISLLALIPGPILYGVIIDSTCLVWNVSCGKRGNCYIYDRRKMRIYLNLAAIALTSLGVAFDAVVWRLGRNLNLYENNPFVQSKKAKIAQNDKNIQDVDVLEESPAALQ